MKLSIGPMSPLVFLSCALTKLKFGMDTEEKPLSFDHKTILSHQIKNTNNHLNSHGREIYCIITALEDLLKWKDELIENTDGICEKLRFFITPDYNDEQRYSPDLVKILTNKNTIIHFLQKNNLAIECTHFYAYLLSQLYFSELVTPFFYHAINYIYSNDSDTKVDIGHLLGRYQKLKQRDWIETQQDKPGVCGLQDVFSLVSCLFGYAVQSYSDEAMSKGVKDFMVDVHRFLSDEDKLKRLTKAYLAKEGG